MKSAEEWAINYYTGKSLLSEAIRAAIAAMLESPNA